MSDKLTEDRVIAIKAKWLVHVAWAMLVVLSSIAVYAVPRIYGFGETASQRDNKLIQVQTSVIELQGQVDRLEHEVEWLVRHNPDGKDAPLDLPSHPQSYSISPNLAEEFQDQDAGLPSNYVPQR